MRLQNELENTIYDVPGLNNMDDLCHVAKGFVKTGGHGRIFCSAIEFFFRAGK